MQRDNKRICRYCAVFECYGRWSFGRQKERKSAYDVTALKLERHAAAAAAAAVVVVVVVVVVVLDVFVRMWASLECWQSGCWWCTEICTLLVGRQKVWSFCKRLLLPFTSSLLTLRLLIAYCMQAAAGWFAFAWLYLCYRLRLLHSSMVVMKCFVVFIIVILSWLVTFGIALLIVLLLYNHVLLRDNRHCKWNVFKGLMKKPLNVFAWGNWTQMVGHRCNGDAQQEVNSLG